MRFAMHVLPLPIILNPTTCKRRAQNGLFGGVGARPCWRSGDLSSLWARGLAQTGRGQGLERPPDPAGGVRDTSVQPSVDQTEKIGGILRGGGGGVWSMLLETIVICKDDGVEPTG